MLEYLTPDVQDMISKLGFPIVAFLLLFGTFIRFSNKWMDGHERRAERVADSMVVIAERQTVMDGKLDRNVNLLSEQFNLADQDQDTRHRELVKLAETNLNLSRQIFDAVRKS